MRAREFLAEKNFVKTGHHPHRHHEAALPGAHRVGGTADRLYDLNRVMMCVAADDGTGTRKIDRDSWVGRNNIATPYTKIEADMLKNAYRMADVEWDDALAPNLDNISLETKDVYHQSPIQPFRGYPR